MTRVIVDSRCLNTAHLRGMGRYLASMLQATEALVTWEWDLISNRPDLPFAPLSAGRYHKTVFDMKGYRFHTWEQIALPWKSRRADVLFCPGTTLPWWQPIPTVVTIHDTIPWESQECSGGKTWYWNRLQRRAVSKAAAIIVPSESSKQDVVRLWPLAASKIHVIPHGLGPEWKSMPAQGAPERLCELGVRSPYLVYVGGDVPRKRLAWALKVFAELREECHLLIIGGTSSTHALVNSVINQATSQRVTILPFITDEEVPALIRNAVAVLYPTLYEGFGFPALEAQAVGTPVLFSAVGSLAELQGPGAVVLPAQDFAAWVDATRELVATRSSCLQPNDQSRTWANQFCWQASARAHLAVLQSVV